MDPRTFFLNVDGLLYPERYLYLAKRFCMINLVSLFLYVMFDSLGITSLVLVTYTVLVEIPSIQYLYGLDCAFTWISELYSLSSLIFVWSRMLSYLVFLSGQVVSSFHTGIRLTIWFILLAGWIAYGYVHQRFPLEITGITLLSIWIHWYVRQDLILLLVSVYLPGILIGVAAIVLMGIDFRRIRIVSVKIIGLIGIVLLCHEIQEKKSSSFPMMSRNLTGNESRVN